MTKQNSPRESQRVENGFQANSQSHYTNYTPSLKWAISLTICYILLQCKSLHLSGHPSAALEVHVKATQMI